MHRQLLNKTFFLTKPRHSQSANSRRPVQLEVTAIPKVTIRCKSRENMTKHQSIKPFDFSRIFSNPLLKNGFKKSIYKVTLNVNWIDILNRIAELVKKGDILDLPICESVLMDSKLHTIKHWLCTNKDCKVLYLPSRPNSVLCDILRSISMRKPSDISKGKDKAAILYISSGKIDLVPWKILFCPYKEIVGVQFLKNNIQDYDQNVYINIYRNGKNFFYQSSMSYIKIGNECHDLIINGLMAHSSLRVIDIIETVLNTTIHTIKIAYLHESSILLNRNI
jgi:hypothetical protein